MKKIIIFSLFFSLLIVIPLYAQAKEVALLQDEEYGSYYKYSKSRNAVDKSKKQTETIYENVFDSIFNFKSNITPPSQNNPTPTDYPNNPTDPQVTQNPNDPSELNYAKRFVDTIHASCNGGYVNQFNAPTCLNSLSQVAKEETIEKLKFSATENGTLQCVGCADAMAFERGRPLSSSAGSAKHYLNLGLSNYRKVLKNGNYRQQIVPGSLFITNAGTYGHIGYIVEVAPDKSWFRAFECNAPRDGYVRLQIWDMASPAGWQVPT